MSGYQHVRVLERNLFVFSVLERNVFVFIVSVAIFASVLCWECAD